MRSGCESSAKASNGWDTSETERTGYYNVKDKPGTPVRQKELVDQGVQSTLLIPIEPIILHKTIRRTEKVSNKRWAISWNTIAVQRTMDVWNNSTS